MLRFPKQATAIGVFIVGMALLCFATYGESLGNNFVNFDDDILIYENPIVWEITPSTVWQAFTSYDPELYIPLTFLTYQTDYLLGGGKPFMFHLGNLLLHTANALLVTWLVHLLWRRAFLAAFCGLIFAVHPLHTEAVAWASARKDVLFAFFFLSSLIAYARYKQKGSVDLYWICLVCFLLSLLSKVTAVTLPVLLVAIDWLQKRRLLHDWEEKIPFFVFSAVFTVIAILGKTHMLGVSSTHDKILMAFKSVTFYVEKLFHPVHLAVIYPFSEHISLQSLAFWPHVALTCLACSLAAATIHRTRTIAFCTLFFLVTVAPTFLNFAKAGEIFVASDRYAYIPSIGVFVLAGFVLQHLWNVALWGKVTAVAVTAALVLTLSPMARLQAQKWKDDEVFFSHALAMQPNSAISHNNYANALVKKERYGAAVREYRTAIALKPDMVRPYANLVLALSKDGKMEEAFTTLAEAMNRFPENGELYFSLGSLYAMQRQEVLAKEAWAKAIELDSWYVQRNLIGIQNEINARNAAQQ